MKRRIWDRRRMKERDHGASIIVPDRQSPKGHRKKGVRRRRAASLLLGLSTILPVPTAKLIHPGSSKESKKHQTVGSTTKSSLFSGFLWNGELELWTPPSFENQKSDTAQSSVTVSPVEAFAKEDLMPDFSFSDIVYPISMKYEVDWRLVAAVIQAESSFQADAVSPVGARGLMQLMPATAADYGVTLKNIHDPEANVEAGVRHLKRLSQLYDGDIPLIAAAYNAGQGTVAKFAGIPPFEETINYVERVVSYYNSFGA
jgi:hypothetical protein